MKAVEFHKMVASGNDFVVIDNRKGSIHHPAAFARKICDRHLGAGADGVLLYENSRRGDFKMRIINADGSEADACGNGFRCIARFANEKLGLPARFRFEALSGLVRAEIKGSKVRVQLPVPHGLRLRDEIDVGGNRLHFSFINTGVPHAVILVQGLKKIDVDTLGRAVRLHRKFSPHGTNVNFVEVKGRNFIHVRTYERGVEYETKACGTGSTASAIVSSLLTRLKPPVKVKTSGGEMLTVNFRQKQKKIFDVTLEGDARFVYQGEYISQSVSRTRNGR